MQATPMIVATAATLAVLVGLPSPTCAQDAGLPSGDVERMAIVPWVFQDGTKGAVATARECLSASMSKLGIELVSEDRVIAEWNRGLKTDLANPKRSLPTAKELLTLGQQLGVKWVLTGRAKWHTKTIWVALGPKTKSDCTVDLMIVDVPKSEVALNAKQVRMDDTAVENTCATLFTLTVFPVTVFSGGPKTPHEKRAAVLAIAKAIEPWLSERAPARARSRKIE